MERINDVDLKDARALLMDPGFMQAASEFASEVDRIRMRTINLHTELSQSLSTEEAGRIARQIVTDARAEHFVVAFKELIKELAAALDAKDEKTTH